MDRRSWPWKKKSSDKAAVEKAVAVLHSAGASLDSAVSQGDKDNYTKPKYVQISVESYSHLTGLEDQVKTYEDQVKTLEDQVEELNEKLLSTQSEMTTKENLVKQHAKVTEDAVSGWEKAEAEALALKNNLESVTLLKLTAEDRASHLDGALKECMQQIRNLKEEHEHKLHEVVLNKTKQWDKVKLELEVKITNLDQEFHRSAAENAALSRSLQECSNMLIKMSEEKSQAEAEIELLKSNIESCEREINSFKYEFHIISKELEIRNEEKNMSVRSKTVKKLQSFEAQLDVHNQQRSSLKSDVQIYTEGSFSQNASKPPSLTSMSEDGNDDKETCSGSLASELISEIKKEKNVKQSGNADHLELMDDFLEMEKLAYLSNNSNGVISSSVISKNIRSQIVNHDALMEAVTGTDFQAKEQSGLDPLANQISANEELSALDPQSVSDPFPLIMKLQSRISMLFQSLSKDADVEKILVDIRRVVQETHDSLHQQPTICPYKECSYSDATCDRQACPEEAEVTAAKEISLSQDSKPGAETVCTLSQELLDAISQIHDFVLFMGKGTLAIQGRGCPGGDRLTQKFEEFSGAYDKVINTKISLVDFVLELSYVLTKSSELQFSVLGCQNNEIETISSDCIDKVALPEYKMVQDSLGEKYLSGCSQFSDSASDPDIPHEGNFDPTFESNAMSWKCSLEEFEQLKLEKENMVTDLVRCTENLDGTKSQLQETEQLLAEVKSQLASAQKLNSLAETQLKCMAESYISLETRAEELQTEVNLLRAKTENLNNELQEERRINHDALARCKDLQEQLQRLESCAVVDIDIRTNQEKEFAAAAEKLAECQEPYFFLASS